MNMLILFVSFLLWIIVLKHQETCNLVSVDKTPPVINGENNTDNWEPGACRDAMSHHSSAAKWHSTNDSKKNLKK